MSAAGEGPRVAIVQRALRRYRAGFYEQLREELARDDIELLLLHSAPPTGQGRRDDALELSWATPLARRDLRVGPKKLVWQPYVHPLRQVDLVIVEQASHLLLNYRLFLEQTRGRAPVALWGHGQNLHEDGRSALGEQTKRWLSRQAHWWFPYTQRSADLVAGFGYPRERITVTQNAIDTRRLAHELAEVDPRTLDRLRRDLGLGDGPVGLFLGALRSDKRLDSLFEAAARIRAVRGDFHLLVVGAGPLESEVRARAHREPWLHYLGSRYGHERAEVLALADVLLIPGWVGLVVLDGFVAGTPLITSTHGPHPPEIAYLRDGENGLLVDDDGDPDRYAQAVLEVLDDGALYERLARGCRADSQRYSIEEMATRFAGGIKQALAAPRLRRDH